jgi:tripeptide aminopeptidase
MQLMAIPGKSGQEGEVARFITQRLRDVGLPDAAIRIDGAHRRTPVRGDTGNVILRLPGTYRGPRRLLSAHMDTVPICVGCRPVRKGNQIRSAEPQTGLGADDRAGCAVLLHTVETLVQQGLDRPPLTFCWFIQEETGLHGARLLSRSLLGKPTMAFNWDGGSPAKLTVGATGGYRIHIEIRGRASHAGGAPEQGVSAIAIAALAIADLQRGGWHGDVNKEGRHGTSNVGFIQGGEATNVVTDRVQLRAEARSHDPEFRQCILAEIKDAFARAAREVRNVAGQSGEVDVVDRLDYEAFLLGPDEPCVLIAEEAIRTVDREPQRAITNGGVDANWLVSHGIPTVSLGCGQRNQHMVGESLDLADFADACRIALRLATPRE